MISDEEILAVADQCLYGGKDYGIIEFAHRIAELQRNLDAKVCKKVSYGSGGDQYNMFGKDLAIQCAAAIRSQGETK